MVLIEELLASHKRNKRIIIAFLTLVLVLLFAVELMYSLGTEHAWQLDLLKVIKGVMAVAYGLIFVAFAPLFILFVRLLKRSFREMYLRMRVKLYVSFLAFMILMGFRFAVYVLLQFSHVAWLNVESLDGEIPLYVSEILITLCYLKIMVSLSNKQRERRPVNEEISRESTVENGGVIVNS